MGSGNKTMEMTIADQLLQMRQLFDPDAQREILREITFAITNDADKAERWVPDQPLKVTDSVHDAQLATGTLMQGLPVSIKTGMNHQEYVQTMLQNLQLMIQKTQQQGGIATGPQIEGYQAIAQHIEQHLKILAEDKTQKAFVADAQKALAKLMNFVRAFAQRLQEQQQKAQQQGGGIPPEAQAKIQSTQLQAKVKASNMTKAGAQKLAQAKLKFEQDQKQKAQEFQQEQVRENMRTAHDMHRTNLKSMTEGGGGSDDQ